MIGSNLCPLNEHEDEIFCALAWGCLVAAWPVPVTPIRLKIPGFDTWDYVLGRP
jgi:hypothetical protein